MTLEDKILEILCKAYPNFANNGKYAKDIASLMREELIKYDRWYWGQRSSEKEVIEYLKTRQ
jgi:hypothetical protein